MNKETIADLGHRVYIITGPDMGVNNSGPTSLTIGRVTQVRSWYAVDFSHHCELLVESDTDRAPCLFDGFTGLMVGTEDQRKAQDNLRIVSAVTV